MSIRAMMWVWHDERTTRGHDRLVLLALADEADDDGGSCHPSYDRLARKANVHRQTAMDAVARLEAAGLIVVERPSVYGRGHHNRYTLTLGGSERVVQADHSDQQLVERGPRNGRAKPSKGSAQDRPDPSTDPSIDPERHPSARARFSPGTGYVPTVAHDQPPLPQDGAERVRSLRAIPCEEGDDRA